MMLTGRERERERERERDSNALDNLLSGIRREEDVAAGVREGSGQETIRIERAL